ARDMSADVLHSAFFFKTERTPPPHRQWNVYHLSALLIALIDAVAFMGGFLLLGLSQIGDLSLILWGTFLALAMLLAHMEVYDAMLRPRKKVVSPAASQDVVAQPTGYTPENPMPNQPMETQTIYQGKLLSLRVETIQLPSGKTDRREIIDHPPAVVI